VTNCLDRRRRRSLRFSLEPTRCERLLGRREMGLTIFSRRGRSLFRQPPGQVRRPRCRRARARTTPSECIELPHATTTRRRQSIDKTASQTSGPALRGGIAKHDCGTSMGSLGRIFEHSRGWRDVSTGCCVKTRRALRPIPSTVSGGCGGATGCSAWSHGTLSATHGTAPAPTIRIAELQEQKPPSR